ncbi:MAG: hypothetical protein IIC85_04050 [Chloroflexi bacterium]|nr:hypothetical protein [Chloroflexota bacterium]
MATIELILLQAGQSTQVIVAEGNLGVEEECGGKYINVVLINGTVTVN